MQVFHALILTLFAAGTHSSAQSLPASTQTTQVPARTPPRGGPLVTRCSLILVEMVEPEAAASEVSAGYEVDPDGAIKLPMLSKPISVAGLTFREAAQVFAAAYRAEDIYSQSHFVVSSPAGGGATPIFTVTVDGNWQEMALRRRLRLLSAVDAARRWTEFEANGKIKLVREGETRDYEFKSPGMVSDNPLLCEGDKIVVESGNRNAGYLGDKPVPAKDAPAHAQNHLPKKEPNLTKLAAGDLLTLTVLAPEPYARKPSVDYVIRSDGSLSLPGLEKPVRLAGLDRRMAAHEIAAAYHKDGVIPGLLLHISSPMESGPLHIVTVYGTLLPGDIAFRPGMTLLSAITKAGGFFEVGANLKRVKLLRRGQVFVYDIRKMTPRGEGNPVLEMLDIVVLGD